MVQLGFPANETFREKMRKFVFAFRKLFHEISQFFAKRKEAKKCENCANFRENIFGKCENFVKMFLEKNSEEALSVIAATINAQKKTCGIL